MVLFFGIAIGLRVFFAVLPPTGSDDYHRYIWDGKVQLHGINPYKHAPNDSSLDMLHTESLPAKINFPGMKTIYFPVSQVFFAAAYIIGGHTYYGLKLLFLLSEFLTFFFLLGILKNLKVPDGRILLYLFSPLILFQILLDAHIDGFGVMLLAGSLYFYSSNKLSRSALFYGLSLLVKPAALLLLPLFFQDIRKKKGNAWLFSGLTFSVMTAGVLPYLFSASIFTDLGTFAKNWFFNSSFFMLFLEFTGNNQTARYICGVLLIGVMLLILKSKRQVYEKFFLSFMALFLLSPVVHPWYLAWLVLLLPLTPARSGIFYASTASLCFFTVYQYQTAGIWQDYPIILLLEYLPVIYFLSRELYFNRKALQPGATN